MSQMTLYLPEDLETRIRRAAERSHRSLSAFVTDVLRREVQPSGWPRSFRDALGAWEGPLERPQDMPPREPPEVRW